MKPIETPFFLRVELDLLQRRRPSLASPSPQCRIEDGYSVLGVAEQRFLGACNGDSLSVLQPIDVCATDTPSHVIQSFLAQLLRCGIASWVDTRLLLVGECRIHGFQGAKDAARDAGRRQQGPESPEYACTCPRPSSTCHRSSPLRSFSTKGNYTVIQVPLSGAVGVVVEMRRQSHAHTSRNFTVQMLDSVCRSTCFSRQNCGEE